MDAITNPTSVLFLAVHVERHSPVNTARSTTADVITPPVAANERIMPSRVDPRLLVLAGSADRCLPNDGAALGAAGDPWV